MVVSPNVVHKPFSDRYLVGHRCANPTAVLTPHSMELDSNGQYRAYGPGEAAMYASHPSLDCRGYQVIVDPYSALFRTNWS
jgi:hypothetical protein